MDQFLAFTVSGLTTAAIYAIVASGLVLTYTTTGVFNFAQGAMAMLGAFVYWQLRFDWGLPAPLALLLTLGVFGPLFGWGLARVLRGVQGLSETITLVATLGLLLGIVGVAQFIWDPVKHRPMTPFFDGNRVEIAGVGIPWDQLITMALAAAVAVGLAVLLRRTRAGVAMRASVDDPDLATLYGSQPARSGALAWALGTSLAVLSGILVAPTIQLNALQLSLLIVNAYGAAAIGRLRSIPLTFLGALVLGLGRDYFIGYRALLPESVAPFLATFATAIPGVVLLVVTMVLPATRLRGRTGVVLEQAHRPTVRGGLALAAACVAVTALLVPMLTNSALLGAGQMWGIAIVALSLVPLIGMTGQISLAQFSFAGIGAVAYAHLGVQNPIALLFAAVAAGFVGAVVALPTIRLAGIYLALATGAVAVMLDQWIFLLPELTIFGHQFFLFGGGSVPALRPHFLGLNLESSAAYFIYSATVFALLTLLVVAIRRSAFGQRLIAVKEAPAAAASLGIDVARTKLAVFTLSAAIAGVGGAVIAGAQQSVAQDGFSFFAGLPILLVMVVAGASLPGAAVATGLFLAGSAVLALTPLAPMFKAGNNIVSSIAIGTVALGLARNPDGAVAALRRAYQPLLDRKLLLLALLVSLGVAFSAGIAGVVDRRTFGWIITVALIGAPLLAAAGRRRAEATSTTARSDGRHARERSDRPVELLGLTIPYQADDAPRLDALLGLDEAHRGVARV